MWWLSQQWMNCFNCAKKGWRSKRGQPHSPEAGEEAAALLLLPSHFLTLGYLNWFDGLFMCMMGWYCCHYCDEIPRGGLALTFNLLFVTRRKQDENIYYSHLLLTTAYFCSYWIAAQGVVMHWPSRRLIWFR